MLKRLLAFTPAVALGSALVAQYIRLVYATSTVRRDPADTEARLFAQHPQILAIWHGQFLLLPKLKPERPGEVSAMVSRHGDAELIGAVLRRFDIGLIRGAGAGKRRRDRGGATAFRESLRALASGASTSAAASNSARSFHRAPRGARARVSLRLPPSRGARSSRSPSPPSASSSFPPGARLPSISPFRRSLSSSATQ